MKIGRLYFAAQAVAGAGWWIAVFTSPWVRTATIGTIDPVALAAFDIPLFVAASALAAADVRPAVWIATGWTLMVAVGMAVYATLTTQAGWGALAMIAASGGSVLASLLLIRGRIPIEWIIFGPFVFRPARPGSVGYVPRTLGQILVFWGLFLGVIPLIITWVERRWQLSITFPLPITISGGVIFLFASVLGLWSARTMATVGEGTPLPSATSNRLVISGPYRFVRNPMAVSGIIQGIAVGLLLESWLVIVYAVVGSLVWNWIVRPQEEVDLIARFGDDYVSYQANVRCWVPKFGVSA